MSEISKLNGYDIKDLKSIRSYDTVSDMKSDTSLRIGQHIKTKGYYSTGDGGDSEYIVIDDNTLIEDGGSIHELTNGLRAKLIVDKEVLASQFGAKIGIESSEYLNNALSYVNENKNITLVIDNSYTFDEIDLTGIDHISIKGTNESNKISINESIIIPTNHNNFENLYFELQTDTTLLNVSGKYNNFTNCKFYGKNNHTGIGANISSFVNTFLNCSFREFKQCIIVSHNEINFINCNIIGNDSPTENENTITVSDGININFTNCDIEKGYHIINVTGGLCNFNNCYIEGATSRYHIMLVDGIVTLENNYLHNVRVGKYNSAKLTFINNTIEKQIADDYCVYPLESNIGYLVIMNNKFTDANGYIINIDNIRGVGITAPCPRYYNGNSWVAGTRDDYICIVQERCYEFGTGNGILTAQILPVFKPNSGSSYHRTLPAINTLVRGDTFYDITLNKLLVKTTDGWVDYDGNAIT